MLLVVTWGVTLSHSPIICKKSMVTSISKLQTSRQNGKHQVDEQRANILNAAEKLFMAKGIEHTSMLDIASQAGITKMSLYRYFANRDEIAYEIHVAVMNRILTSLDLDVNIHPAEGIKKLAQSMIRNFDQLHEAYRYMGMFDKLYLDNPPETMLTQWTKQQLQSLSWNGITLDKILQGNPQANRSLVAMSTVIWFLEKLALRGELTWSDPSIPLEEHLKLFEEMIMKFLEGES